MNPSMNPSMSGHEFNIAEYRLVAPRSEASHDALSRSVGSGAPPGALDPGISQSNCPAATEKKPRSKAPAKTSLSFLYLPLARLCSSSRRTSD